MAERSTPFDSVEGDRQLDTAQWARMNRGLALNGVVPGFPSELEVVETSPATLGVDVGQGRFWLQGRLYEVFSEPETVELDAADPSNPRIDRIVVRRDLSEREIRVGKLTGTPAADPTPPALTQQAGGVWEEPLARVLVAANATSVSNSDITDERALSTFGAIGIINEGLRTTDFNNVTDTPTLVGVTGLGTVRLFRGRRYGFEAWSRVIARASGDIGSTGRFRVLVDSNVRGYGTVSLHSDVATRPASLHATSETYSPALSGVATVELEATCLDGAMDIRPTASSPLRLVVRDVGPA